MSNEIIITRKTDEKRRIVTPFEPSSQIYMAKKGTLVLLSSNPRELEAILEAIEMIEKQKTIKIINDWFDLVEKAGLNDLTAKELHHLTSQGITPHLEKNKTNQNEVP